MAVIRMGEIGDERLGAYVSLTNRQLRRSLEAANGLFIAESALVVEKALALGYRPHSLLVAERRLENLEPLLSHVPARVSVFALPDAEIEKLTGYRVHRGVLGAFERPAPGSMASLLAEARNLCVLEASVDAANVGAIFRAAAALGADGVLLDPTCADPLERRCLRTSMGCVLELPFARAGAWPEPSMGTLRDRGFTVVSCALRKDARDLREFARSWRARRAADPEARLALVFGTEGAGLAPETIAASDASVVIPMARTVDSLNVASAAAIFFWELF